MLRVGDSGGGRCRCVCVDCDFFAEALLLNVVNGLNDEWVGKGELRCHAQVYSPFDAFLY